MAGVARGLNPRGTPFRMRRGGVGSTEGGSAVELGEELLVVAEGMNSPPHACSPEQRRVISHNRVNWRMWRIELPSESSPTLGAMGREYRRRPSEPSWKVSVISVPHGFNSDDHVPILGTKSRLLRNILGGKADERVEFQSLGLSEGFGSFHFSKETLRLMSMLIGLGQRKPGKANSIFGEGVNPLMRKIREALEQRGSPSDNPLSTETNESCTGFLSPRNFRDVLLGLSDTARYYIPLTRERYRTELLADFWRQRWLLKRLEKLGILDEVATHTVVYPIRHGAQVVLPNDPSEAVSLWE